MAKKASRYPDRLSTPKRLPQSDFVWLQIGNFVSTPCLDVVGLPTTVGATIVATDLADCLMHIRECCRRERPDELTPIFRRLIFRFNDGLFSLTSLLIENGGIDQLHDLNGPKGVETTIGEEPAGSYAERVLVVAKLFYLLCLCESKPNDYSLGLNHKWPGPRLGPNSCWMFWEEISTHVQSHGMLERMPALCLAIRHEHRKVKLMINERDKAISQFEATGNGEPGYLDIVLDESNQTITRVGSDVPPIELSSTLWALCRKFVECGASGVSRDQLDQLPGELTARKMAISQLRSKLTGLALKITSGAGGKSRVLEDDSA